MKKVLIKKLKSLAPFIYNARMTEDIGCEFSGISEYGVIYREPGMLLSTSSEGQMPDLGEDNSEDANKEKLEEYFSELPIVPYDDLSEKELEQIMFEIENIEN